MYELVIEIVFSFWMPVFLAKIRPEFYRFNFLKIALDFLKKRINNYGIIALFTTSSVFFTLEKYGFFLISKDVY